MLSKYSQGTATYSLLGVGRTMSPTPIIHTIGNSRRFPSEETKRRGSLIQGALQGWKI